MKADFSRDLRALANWLLLRSVQDHAPRTTLTILKRKAEALQAKHTGAGKSGAHGMAESAIKESQEVAQ